MEIVEKIDELIAKVDIKEAKKILDNILKELIENKSIKKN